MPVIKSTGYAITISEGSFAPVSKFLAQHHHTSYTIICDENTLRFCLPALVSACEPLRAAHIIEIESGEGSKSIEISAQIWQTLLDNAADKYSLVINLGGGVVSDLGGFAASTFKRGIDFIHIPTTLLAMADASVGGKTGIDFAGVKNAVGTFAQPRSVFVNTQFLKTLPQRHITNGLAEVYKIALVCDRDLWNELKTTSIKGNMKRLITLSISLKNALVLQDPFDKGKRKALNFGHTLGHALEALLLASDHELLHGEAVVCGMMMETHLAYQEKLITKKEMEEIVSELESAFTFKKPHAVLVEQILPFLKQDKKNSGNRLLFSLPSGIGRCDYDVAITAAQLKKAIHFYNTLAG